MPTSPERVDTIDEEGLELLELLGQIFTKNWGKDGVDVVRS